MSTQVTGRGQWRLAFDRLRHDRVAASSAVLIIPCSLSRRPCLVVVAECSRMWWRLWPASPSPS